MKKRIKILCMFLLTCATLSCGTTDYNDHNLIGEYEFIDEKDGKSYKVQIITTSNGLQWNSVGAGLHPIKLNSDVDFEVLPFEKWGFVNTIEGKLLDDELQVTQEVFELQDLETPILISNRIYIRK
jgi:hypothetical protein